LYIVINTVTRNFDYFLSCDSNKIAQEPYIVIFCNSNKINLLSMLDIVKKIESNNYNLLVGTALYLFSF
jgi:hypothetical protein